MKSWAVTSIFQCCEFIIIIELYDEMDVQNMDLYWLTFCVLTNLSVLFFKLYNV